MTEDVTYQLDRKYTHFHAMVGIADTPASGLVGFAVNDDSDGTQIGEVNVEVGQSPVSLDVDVTDKFRITLEVQPSVCAPGTPAFIDPTVT